MICLSQVQIFKHFTFIQIACFKLFVSSIVSVVFPYFPLSFHNGVKDNTEREGGKGMGLVRTEGRVRWKIYFEKILRQMVFVAR